MVAAAAPRASVGRVVAVERECQMRVERRRRVSGAKMLEKLLDSFVCMFLQGIGYYHRGWNVCIPNFAGVGIRCMYLRILCLFVFCGLCYGLQFKLCNFRRHETFSKACEPVTYGHRCMLLGSWPNYLWSIKIGTKTVFGKRHT